MKMLPSKELVDANTSTFSVTNSLAETQDWLQILAGTRLQESIPGAGHTISHEQMLQINGY